MGKCPGSRARAARARPAPAGLPDVQSVRPEEVPAPLPTLLPSDAEDANKDVVDLEVRGSDIDILIMDELDAEDANKDVFDLEVRGSDIDILIMEELDDGVPRITTIASF